MNVLVTGVAGFIGSNVVLDLVANTEASVVNLDKLTYAGNLDNLRAIDGDPRHVFIRGDIGDRKLVRRILATYQPQAVLNLAAESHVDRSILGPEDFIHTNVNGTFHLLEEVLEYRRSLSGSNKSAFRFLHVSTDEVYGSLAPDDPAFSESTPYAPNSPYAASKAASDHLVRAYYHTYGLPTITTSCSNNYGPYQFPEKFIPLVIVRAREGKSIPIYGDGLNVRDWLHVSDHCDAVRAVLNAAKIGETYNIGGLDERTNLEVVDTICDLMDELVPDSAFKPHSSLREFVADRPGHDRRYAMDTIKIENDLGWKPKDNFQSGIRKMVQWFLENMDWIARITSGEYRRWMIENYENRV